jgi:hypothetical protein
MHGSFRICNRMTRAYGFLGICYFFVATPIARLRTKYLRFVSLECRVVPRYPRSQMVQCVRVGLPVWEDQPGSNG